MTQSTVLSRGKIFFTIFYLMIWPAILFFLAANWRWTEGWIFSVWFLCMCISIIIYLYKKDPDLLNERYKTQKNASQKKSDILLTASVVISFAGWFMCMPLDAGRFKFSPAFPLWVKTTGIIGLCIS